MILMINTASSKIRLALGDGAGGTKTAEKESQQQSAELPIIARALLDGRAPEAIGVATGPGSFTGIRLGIAFAKGLAMGFGVPVLGINIFELAGNFVDGNGGGAGIKATAIDSGRGDYFIYENGEYKIAAELPAGARIIDMSSDAEMKTLLLNGIEIVRKKLKDGRCGGNNAAAMPAAMPPVIPLYIRPSYVG